MLVLQMLPTRPLSDFSAQFFWPVLLMGSAAKCCAASAWRARLPRTPSELTAFRSGRALIFENHSVPHFARLFVDACWSVLSARGTSCRQTVS